ncbi:thiamine diphosphokinase [Orenia marismortui]|uniref:Thiamine diphosphokinase n=1 Tax=Orenia marismortui TaxID=46469 RepID=A0A4R8GZN3_9FIRM|nr:thiamine diphosphokinase [Orenia marismortui]TDX52321.1 thiamine diphosphokinase [Orenia marismortui]
MKRVVLFINGELRGEKDFYLNYIRDNDKIICADGGAKHTYKLGLIPDLILGDLDSIPAEVFNYYQKKGVEFAKYPANKDKSDTQLVLEKLIGESYDEIILFAALGGRLDHTLANLYLLEHFNADYFNIKLISQYETVELITDEKQIVNKINKTVSFLPLTKEVKGVYLTGFKYKLVDAVFTRGDTLGLSNIIKSKVAKVQISKGKMLMTINN